MIAVQEKPIHWAEAFGLSALFHVGLIYFVLTAVVDLRSVFESTAQTTPSLQITSLSIDSNSLTSTDIGGGTDSQNIPETVAPVEDAVAPLAPVVPGETLAEQLRPVSNSEDPLPATSPPIEVTSAVSPLRPETATLAPISMSQTGAVLTKEAAQSIESANEVSDRTNPSDVVEPIARELTPVAEPEAPPPAEAAPPSTSAEPDPLAADLIDRIRSAVGEACLIAIPQQNADGTIGVQVYAADEAIVGPYLDGIFEGLDTRPNQSTYLIDPRQCAALDYVRQAVAYPTSPLTLSLDLTQIESGAELTGRISGTGGRNLSVVLIDDNGVVQNLGPYVNVAVNTARIAVPLRRAGTVRDTRQLLLALGTNAPPDVILEQNGQLASTYFEALAGEIGGNAVLALVPFEVR